MKNIKIVFCISGIFLLNMICYAQTSDFTLGVILPNITDDINQNQVQKLDSKIAQIINNSNQATLGYSNDFVIYPIISIEESNIVEGGMQNITVTSLDFSLFIKQISTDIVYNTISQKIKGSGTNKSQSITNAISQINTFGNIYSQFISKAKQKMFDYYNNNCNAIIQQADNLAARQNFEQAISILQSIPSCSCSNEAGKKSLEYYNRYQNILCTKSLTKAKADIAINNYSSALEELEIIDPTSKCYGEVKALINQISSKVENQKMQDLDLEKTRINAMKEIAKSYYSNTVKLVSYDLIIR